MRSHSIRHKPKILPRIGQLDIRPYPVQVPEGSGYVEKPGFALFLTGFDQLSGGELRQVGTERPLYAHTDRRMVKARAKYHLNRKMRRAYRQKDILIQMAPE
jgi:hypothetical protein